MDSPVRRRSVAALVVALAVVLLPIGAAWAYWVATAPVLSSTGAAAQVPTVTGLACAENGDQGVTVSWTAATPPAPTAYGYTANLAQTGPTWTGSMNTTAVSLALTPGTLPATSGSAHNGAVTVSVVTRHPQAGAGWTSTPSASVTFYQKTKYLFWIIPYTALDCAP